MMRKILLMAVIIMLSACGGGGGGDNTNTQITANCIWASSGGNDTTWNNCNWQ